MYASLRTFLVILLMGLCLPIVAFAQDIEKIPLALGGNDVVTYFLSPAPEKGNKAYQAIYRDKRYLFVNSENQEQFASDPEKYLPEFDAYCGCAISEGKLVKADPAVFKITDGKLILFENTDAFSNWNENESERYEKAQEFWKYESEYSASERLRDDTRVQLFKF